jgi:translation initiation factor IF-2
MAQMGKGEGQLSLNLVIKADVQGSVEALRQSLTALSNDQIRINVISSGVGGITESDASAAATAKATVIGFNVRADASARKVIDSYGVDLRYFSIIYDVIDQVKQVASGILGVEIREEIIGTAEARRVAPSSARLPAAVVEGVVKRTSRSACCATTPWSRGRAGIAAPLGERRRGPTAPKVRHRVKAYNDVKPGDQIEA